MNAPFGITFLKKAELYNEYVKLESEYSTSKKSDSKKASLWPVEKAILEWTYGKHKYLGSPIKTRDLSPGSKDNKLKDFGMINSQGKLKNEYEVLNHVKLKKPLENIVVRGFGSYYYGEEDHSAIVINREGLLFGKLLNELKKENLLIKFNYFIYGKLMNHTGAFVLLIVTVITLINLLLVLILRFKEIS